MGTISSGIGLVSGLDIDGLVKKLIELESGATNQLKAQIERSTQVQAALQTISLRVVGANLAASRLGKGQAFSERSVSTSSDALSVTAGKGAPLGSFSFTPRRLVSTHQILSTGYASAADVVSPSATTLKLSQGGFVDESTTLSSVNGGAGVRAGSIRILDSNGGTSVVDLTGAVTVRDVVDEINGSTGANVTARVQGDRIELVDNASGGGVLQVQEVAGGATAADLGLTTLTPTGNVYAGQDIYSLGTGLALNALRDGNGVRDGAGNDFSITVGSVSFNVDLSGARTVGDVLGLINNNAGNTGGRVLASVNGDHIEISDTQAAAGVGITAIGGSKSAADLGLLNGSGGAGLVTGDDILGSLNTVLLSTLRGGSSTLTPTAGTLTINGANIDLSAATTLADVMSGINSAAVPGVVASLNSAGNGVVVRAIGAGGLTISDASGNLGAFLNIAGTVSGSDVSLNSGDLDRQYINENTSLSSIGSQGVPKGKFSITDGNGATATVDLTQDADDTIGDVIRDINTRGLAIAARLNDTGDGILIEKTAGAGAVSVVDLNGGTTAQELRLTGAANVAGAVDGSLEVSISLSAGAKLSDLVTKIKESGAQVEASLINDGSALNPVRLSLTSKKSGRAGRVLLDAGGTNLSFSTVSAAQDAVLLYGSSGPGTSPIQVVSSKNTFSGLIPGVEVTAQQVSAAPVTVTIGEASESILEAAQGFVSAYNEIRKYINDNAGYDAATETKDLLFTDTTTRQVVRQLANFANSIFRDTGSTLKTLGEVGIKLTSTGELALDETAFQAVLSARPEDIERFFTATDTGVAARFQKFTDTLTAPATGILSVRVDGLGRTLDLQDKTLLGKLDRLKSKEERLYRQFYSMESALASFRSQQSALAQLASLAAGFGG